MKVFSVSVDVANVQWVMPEVPDKDILPLLQFDCVSKSQASMAVPWYVYNPKEPRKNFFQIGPGTFAFDESVYYSPLATCLEMAGEVLTIQVEDLGQLYLLNILECPNCLNKSESLIQTYPDGNFRMVQKYAFHPHRFPESSLFKIPETSKTEIFALSRWDDDDEDFKQVYESLGFSGLVFELLWEG